MSLRDRRIQYETAGLDRGDLDPSPFVQWHRWYDDAVDAELPEPHAMVIGTSTDDLPDARLVLARAVDERGIVFYGNYDSAKGRQLADHPVASAVFAWLGLHRQARVRGRVALQSPAESDAYFASRPRDSQIGAWASPQSQVIADRRELDERVEALERRFADGDVPRPPHWGGWVLRPETFEFWQGRPNRLHDRFRYTRRGDDWIIDRLAP
ncbi:MAG: pyridoxamine 5'-phosphate oxidase [Actinomycetota bacterium]